MKKLIISLLFLISLNNFVVAEADTNWFPIVIWGWVEDTFTSAPIVNHWVYMESHNTIVKPMKDSVKTNLNGFYCFDTIWSRSFNQLDVDIFLFQCLHIKKTVHFTHYHQTLTIVWEICTDPPPNCHAEFDYWSGPPYPLKVNFQDHSQGNITNRLWSFGDGATSTQHNPVHTYGLPGDYQVILTVFDTMIYPPCMDADTQLTTVNGMNHFNLGGQVFKDNFPTHHGKVYLYFQEPDRYILIDSCLLNSNGDYYFYQAPEGKYLIKAWEINNGIPDPGQFPTYFPDKIKWQDADQLFLDHDYYQADIFLKETENVAGGPGAISGNVFTEFNSSILPVEMAEVILSNEPGPDKMYGVSGPGGVFSFPSLAYGTYRLFVETPSLIPFPVIITLDALNPVLSGLELMASSHPIGINEVSNLESIGPVYPNPSDQQASLEINLLKPGNVVVRLSDLTGRTIQTKEVSLPAGPSIIRLDTQDTPSGFYFLTLQSNVNQSVNRKIQIIH
ncbi:MAG: PKD domain-containing protein [Bacteroidetes bacterium]|nr:PKD domain-containing protein [Bacteroidota bacterium]